MAEFTRREWAALVTTGLVAAPLRTLAGSAQTGSNTNTEVQRCLDYCKKALA